MVLDINFKINNSDISNYLFTQKVYDTFPVFTWEISEVDIVVVDEDSGSVASASSYSQSSFEIRISDDDSLIGTDSFLGTIFQTGIVYSKNLFYNYRGRTLSRGGTYYGQIRVYDNVGRISNWKTFSIYYNTLPYVTNVYISPSKPSIIDDLTLHYDFYDSDGDSESGTRIHWFKNGVYQRIFDDVSTVSASYLRNDDIWYAEIFPKDGFEYGEVSSSPSVKIVKTATSVSSVSILPKNPNPNDILKVSYISSDVSETENVFVRWYINDILSYENNDKFLIRPDVSANDKVRVEIKHIDSGLYVSSEDVYIGYGDFLISDIRVDGDNDPLNVSTLTPFVSWKTFAPVGKTVEFISIKIGKFYGSDDVYSAVLEYDKSFYSVPANLLRTGEDYYISISASDSQTFSNYSFSHFRVEGSLWDNYVDNTIGWTFETILYSEGNDYGFHFLRINDGDRFAEIRIYRDKISLISGRNIDFVWDTTQAFVLTIIGKGDDIKIFINRSLSIDGTGLFSQPSSEKSLSIGSYGDLSFSINYKYMNYSVDGYFAPGESLEYTDIQFHDFLNFEDSSIVSLCSYSGGKYIFGVNPDNENMGGSVYAIVAGKSVSIPTVSKTFSPISKIRSSGNGKKTVFSHLYGVSLMTGYEILSYDNESIFVDARGNVLSDGPTQFGWELISDINFVGYYFDADGFNINTIEGNLIT